MGKLKILPISIRIPERDLSVFTGVLPLVFDPADDDECRLATTTASPSKKQTHLQFQAHLDMAKYEAESGFC